MGDSKTAADVTDTPAGLDVVITQPGTIVGSHDLQGTDGTTRTDRPGEILGTPITNDVHLAGQVKEAAKHDYVRQEVDRANREELPRLGGTTDDNWVAGNAPAKAAPATRTTDAAPVARTAAAPAPAKAARAAKAAPVATAKSAPATAHGTGIVVSPTIDRG